MVLIISSASGIVGTYAIRPLINDFIETGDLAGAMKMSRLSMQFLYATAATSTFNGNGGQYHRVCRFIQPYSKFATWILDTNKHVRLNSLVFTNDFLENIQKRA